MGTDKFSSGHNYKIWIYAVLIISSAAVALLAEKNIKISPDSMRFALISQQILSGNGIRVPIIRLEDSYVPVNGAIPFMDQMPLFPMLLALLGGVTPHNFLPAQIINMLSHVLIAVFTFLLMKEICGRYGIALLTGIIVSFSYPLLWLVNHMSSDLLFIAITSMTVYFLYLSRNANFLQAGRNFFIAGLCASLAILTRNAGIAMVPVFLWAAFVLVLKKPARAAYGMVALGAAAPAVATLAMFIRNYMVSGSFRGFNQAAPGRSYISAFTGTVKMISAQFQLGTNSFMAIIILVLFILYSIKDSGARDDLSSSLKKGLDLVIVFIISYTGLIFITMAKQQWNFELRYMSPLVPFIYTIFIFAVVFAWGRMSGRFYKLSMAGLIMSLGIISMGTVYKTYLGFPGFFYQQEKAYYLLSSCTYKWIKENYFGNIIIATNKPYHLSFFGGYSTIALPHKRFDPTINVPDDMESVLPNQMSKWGSSVLALFEEASEEDDGRYVAKLFHERTDNDKFKLLHKCPDGVIYRLRN